MTTEETLNQIRELTRQLPPDAKLRVIRDVTEQLLGVQPAVATSAYLHPGEDPWDALHRIGSNLGSPVTRQPSALNDLLSGRR